MSDEPVKVSLDVFPALVRLPSGAALVTARAMIADGDVVVFIAEQRSVKEQYRAPLLSIEGNATTGFVAQTHDGVVTFKKGGGCGCGNPLKRSNPFAPQPMVRLPNAS